MSQSVSSSLALAGLPHMRPRERVAVSVDMINEALACLDRDTEEVRKLLAEAKRQLVRATLGLPEGDGLFVA